MKKIETIWHHLLFCALEERKFRYTQKELAEQFHYSLSTVNHALEGPTQIGAIRKEAKFFVVEHFQKLLYFWASLRNLSSDILYQTHFAASVTEIEGLLPANSFYACYSAARKILGEPPADYSTVHCYIHEKELDLFKARFPLHPTQPPNVFALKAPPTMAKYGPVTTLPQTFVDIWNLKDWYGQEFIKRLEEKINAILS
jgi:hypothetical protein